MHGSAKQLSAAPADMPHSRHSSDHPDRAKYCDTRDLKEAKALREELAANALLDRHEWATSSACTSRVCGSLLSALKIAEAKLMRRARCCSNSGAEREIQLGCAMPFVYHVKRPGSDFLRQTAVIPMGPPRRRCKALAAVTCHHAIHSPRLSGSFLHHRAPSAQRFGDAGKPCLFG